VQLAQLLQQRFELDAAVGGRVRREPLDRLRELSLHADPASAARLIPRDGDVDESLQEVAFLGRCGAPGVLELLVRAEVFARADQLEAGFKP
jgi:hypothetical protein